MYKRQALLGRRGTDAVGVRGKLHVQRISIGFGIHHHRIDIQLAAGTRHAQGDLAAVGNQQSFEHRTPSLALSIANQRLIERDKLTIRNEQLFDNAITRRLVIALSKSCSLRMVSLSRSISL